MSNMEMPTPCRNCGEWFELHDGRSSIKGNYTVVCSDCAEEEDAALELEKEIIEQKEIIANAEEDIKVAKARLAEINNQ